MYLHLFDSHTIIGSGLSYGIGYVIQHLSILTQYWLVKDTGQDHTSIASWSNKKAVLSQRWPHDAPYIWVPWKFLRLPHIT